MATCKLNYYIEFNVMNVDLINASIHLEFIVIN